MTPLQDLSLYFPIKEGFCRPDWNAIADYIEQNTPEEERQEAWESISRQWLNHLCKGLRGGYRLHETQNFLILSEAPDRVVQEASTSFESALKKILATLGAAAPDAGLGKHVVLMFSELHQYDSYISYYYPEGEHAASGGICINVGYVHFAFSLLDYSSYLSVLVHELTHGCVNHLRLPVWVNEAVAMRMEEVVCGVGLFQFDPEICERHFAHWDEEAIQTFWSGESWNIPGDRSELSYNLAGILWRKIEQDIRATREQVIQFITTAEWQDAGEGACQKIFKMTLGELVSDFLGKGNWTPNPARWQKAVEADV